MRFFKKLNSFSWSDYILPEIPGISQRREVRLNGLKMKAFASSKLIRLLPKQEQQQQILYTHHSLDTTKRNRKRTKDNSARLIVENLSNLELWNRGAKVFFYN